jgi:hypothetical protein
MIKYNNIFIEKIYQFSISETRVFYSTILESQYNN